MDVARATAPSALGPEKREPLACIIQRWWHTGSL